MSHARFASAIAGAVLGATLHGATGLPQSEKEWHPPFGIPRPTFGITDRAPVPPADWVAPTPGFYFVSPGTPGATDRDNPLGTPRMPRATVPRRLPAGSVVELRGRYDAEHTGAALLRAEGTASQPVFIRGDPARPAEILRPWEVSGSYVVVEHLRFKDRDGTTTGSFTFLAPIDHAAIRHSDVSGNRRWGGLAIEGWTGSTAANVVVYDNRIHDNGDVRANFDQDRHGIHVGERVNTVWIVDNEMWRNSGDGIQINARRSALQASTHHIYVGRNVSHHNKQNGFWTKQATDVIFSQNVAYAHRASNSSLGVGLGFQYAPSRVWFIFNHVYDVEYGIQAASDADLGIGTDSYFVGNVIHDVHDSDNDFNPATAWQNCAISLAGGINRHVVHNTIHDVDSGICSPSATGRIDVHNNIVFGVRPDGHHVFVEFPAVAAATKGEGNVFGPTYRLNAGGTLRSFTKEEFGSNSVVRDPGFVRTGSWPLDLGSAAAVIDRGAAAGLSVFRLYRSLYGEDIFHDVVGRPRQSGVRLDPGAFEAPSQAAPR